MTLQEKMNLALRKNLLIQSNPIYSMKWKEVTTPSGLKLMQISASTRRTSGNDCTGWPTATTRDHKDGHEQNVPINSLLGRTGWATPNTNNTKGAYLDPEKNLSRTANGRQVNLQDQVKLSGWPTPILQERPNRDIDNRLKKGSQMGLSEVVRMASNGSTVETTSTGQLNPAFSRWLMGLPEDWCIAAIQANRLMQTQRKKRAQSALRATATLSKRKQP